MKLQYLIFIVLTLCLVNAVTSEKTRKHKKFRKPHKTPQALKAPQVKAEEESSPNVILQNIGKATDAEAPPEQGQISDNNIPILDPCLKVHCGAGRICQLDGEGEPQCVCVPNCPEENDSRRKVCSQHNETWSSDCAVYQQRCFCETGNNACKGPEYKHVHINYYGECRSMPNCSKEEMVDFPRRMRDWLFNIMRDLADREELSPHYLKMEKEAESNMTRRWTNAAIWKFCELDGSPPDRSVSRHELFPIRAPLMALEHCIAPFLNICDEDDNHKITLKEWAKCLELDEDEIEDRCEEITDEE